MLPSIKAGDRTQHPSPFSLRPPTHCTWKWSQIIFQTVRRKKTPIIHRMKIKHVYRLHVSIYNSMLLFTFHYKDNCVIVCCFHWKPLGFKQFMQTIHVLLWTWGYSSRELGVRRSPKSVVSPVGWLLKKKRLEATAVSLTRLGCLHVCFDRELPFDYLPCVIGAWHDFFLKLLLWWHCLPTIDFWWHIDSNIDFKIGKGILRWDVQHDSLQFWQEDMHKYPGFLPSLAAKGVDVDWYGWGHHAGDGNMYNLKTERKLSTHLPIPICCKRYVSWNLASQLIFLSEISQGEV